MHASRDAGPRGPNRMMAKGTRRRRQKDSDGGRTELTLAWSCQPNPNGFSRNIAQRRADRCCSPAVRAAVRLAGFNGRECAGRQSLV